MIFLTPCDACHRHVLNTEACCPFCGAAVTSAMRARLPKPPVGRLGRAAMMALSATVAGTTAACGDDGEGSEKREQPASTSTTPSSSATGSGSSMPGDSPEPAGSMTSMPETPGGPDGNPATPPTGDPSAVALYGVAILPAEPGAGGASAKPGMLDPEPVAEPEPMAVAAYGVFPVEPEPQALPPEPEMSAGGAPSTDSDAGVADPEAVGGGTGFEPEPSVVALYGVPPVPVQ